MTKSVLEAKIGDVIDVLSRLEPSPAREPRWNLLQCVGNSDVAVLEWLKRGGMETYYPKTREMRRVPKRKLAPAQRNSPLPVMRPVIVPMFPRYVFVNFDQKVDAWRGVFGIAGVKGMVCADDQPVVVPEQLIDELRAKENQQGIIPGKTPLRLHFVAGEKVRISDGVFSGFTGEVEETSTANIEDIDGDARIKVLIDFLGRVVAVPLNIWQVEKTA